MSVVSLSDYIPSPRYDGNPWTQALISEAATETGSFSNIDTITLSPVDADPTKPQPRNFTTTHATLASGWYLVTFKDAAGNTQQTTPVPFPPDSQGAPVGTIATLEELKEDLGVTKSTNDARLQRILDGASLFVQRVTAKSFIPNPTAASPATATIIVPVNGPPPRRSFLFGPASPGTPLGPQPTWAEQPVTIPHASSITALSLDTTGVLATGQYILEPDSTLAMLPTSYTRRVVIIDPGMLPALFLTVTGRFGITPVPTDIVDVVLAISARRYKQKDAAWGDSLQTPEGGVISYYRALPPWERAILDSYAEVTM